ncbi:TKL protein kinase, variant 1 [Aphanomyces astaci]|uniref:TKL protein kinase, variant 1 n=1 Tax=Aphanomyces astaci TaxID=112090 RepID=W4GF25_APHAT|nr:TKL protein kinase, variant 1 [Aphanomyces astaci]ETV77654.1 TKL protein kinase, variant 1 [Aphanomyces astaci]|eukprot:XP_009832764.1 TKL protein kinase, variant 1 [Aphanomyces astaci]
MAALNAVAIVANVLVPGAGLVIQNLPQIASFLAGINGKCDQLSVNEAHFQRVSDRLHELLSQLTAMETKGQLPSVQVVKRYAELLESFDAFLTKYMASNFLARLLTQDTVLNKITVFHQEVDELLVVLNLAHIAQMTDWRAQYDADQQIEGAKWTALLQSNRLLVDECSDARKQREAMMRLLHSMQHSNNTTGGSQKQQRQLVKQAFQTLQRLSHAPIEAVPPWFIPPEDVSVNPVAFARGATASVFHGMWRTHTPVVVKCFDTSSSCERELDLWFGLRHPHVLTLYGACHVGARPFALCEVARVSLDQCIVECEQPLSHEKLSRWLWEAALGVQHLHGQNAVHGDLKCNNLLVTHDGHVKVADFGCSFHVHRGDRPPRSSPTMNVGENECQEEGGLRWTAPECLTNSSRTFASDVYALGLCFVEAATRNVPFPECTTDATVKDAIRNNLLPDLSRDNGICTALHSLIASMCCADPSSRPSIATVVDALHDILQAAPQAATCSYCASSLLATALFCHSCGSVVQKPCEDAPSTHLVDPLPSQAPSLLTSEGSTTTPVEVVVREYGYALKSVTEEDATDDTKDDASKRRLHRQSLHLSTSDVQSMVANDDVDSLVNLLVHGRGPIQERALQALHNMTSEATKLVASGVIDPLVHLTTRGVTPTCKELAAAVLGHLAFRSADIAATIRNQGGVTALLKLLRHGTFVQRSFALRGLAHITAVDAASCAMVVADNGLAAVYDMLRGGSGQLLEHAMWILANLSDEADDFALDVSVLPPVVTEVEDMSYDQQHHALRLLANSIGVLPRKITVSLIPVLVTMLRRRQHTHVLVLALATASYISDEFAIQVVEAGAVPLLWTLFQQNQHPQACLVALNNVAISDDCRCQLSRNRGLQLGLGCLVQSQDPAIHTTALHLCFNLALEATNREWMVELGGAGAVLQLILARDDLVLLGLETLARLTLITSSIDSFVPIVAWVVQQLVPRRRDGTPFVDLALELLQNAIATTPGRCEEAFLSAGGVAILLKLLPKCTSHRVSAVLANVATRAETVATIAKEPETVHILATTAGPPSSHLERLHALRCIANMTFFEPGVMVGVKGRGIPLMFDLLAKPRGVVQVISVDDDDLDDIVLIRRATRASGRASDIGAGYSVSLSPPSAIPNVANRRPRYYSKAQGIRHSNQSPIIECRSVNATVVECGHYYYCLPCSVFSDFHVCRGSSQTQASCFCKQPRRGKAN